MRKVPLVTFPPAYRSESSSSASSVVASLVSEFNRDANAASEAVAKSLSPAQRVLLASALRDHIKPEHMNEAYFDDLWAASTEKGQMTE
jgi:hypothetical protein